MMKKISSILFLVFFFCLQAQITNYSFYPYNVEAYENGDLGLYKDLHLALSKFEYQKCNPEDEAYVQVMVFPDKTIKMVRFENASTLVDNSNCASELAKKALTYLRNWKPLIKENVPVNGIYGFRFRPNDLGEAFTEDYRIIETMPLYDFKEDGGINKFREDFFKRLSVNGFNWNATFRLEVVFVVNQSGELEDIHLEESSGIPEFDRRLISAIKGIRKKWKPATINGVPVKYRFRLPVVFNT